MQDPNTLQCPDYDLPEHTQTVTLLINPTTPPAQAAQILKNVWQINNDRDKAAWQLQADIDLVQAGAKKQQQQLEATANEAALALERDTQNKEEKQCNKDKYLPIPLDCGIPFQPHDILSPYEIRSLNKSEYLELWYVSNDRINSAHRSNLTADSNSMVVVSNEDGTTSWQESAPPARGVLADEDLPWEVVYTSCPLLVSAAASAG